MPAPRTLIPLVGVLATVLTGLVGCSTSQEPTAPPPSPDASSSTPSSISSSAAGARQLPADQWPSACDLAASGEIALVTGGSAEEGVPGPPPELDGGGRGEAPGSCTWAVGGSDVSLRLIDVVYPVNELWSSIRIRFPAAEDLEGVATQAFVAQRPDGGTSLLVCQGHTIFEVAAPVDVTVDEGALIDVGAAAAQRVEGPAGTMA